MKEFGSRQPAKKKKKIKLFQVNVPGLAKRKRMFKQRSTGLTKVKFREEFFGLRTSKWSFESRWAPEEPPPPPPLRIMGWDALRSEDGSHVAAI